MTMPPYGSDAERIRNWLERNQGRGKINDEYIITDGSSELRGYVSARDYNDALKLAAPWGGKKPLITTVGIHAFLSRRVNALTPVEIATLPNYQQGTGLLFRGKTNLGTINIFREEIASYGLDISNSQQVTIILRNFIADPTVIRIYQKWIRGWLERTNLSVEEIENIIYDFYRVDGAKKRLILSENGDEDANSEKLP